MNDNKRNIIFNLSSIVLNSRASTIFVSRLHCVDDGLAMYVNLQYSLDGGSTGGCNYVRVGSLIV